jgi:hypothetical protein
MLITVRVGLTIGLAFGVALPLSLGWVPIGASPFSASAARQTQSWCGSTPSSDWLCPVHRRVSVISPGPPTVISETFNVRQPSTILVSPKGEAKMAFTQDAHCLFGTAYEKTKITTRFGGPDYIFRQDQGFSKCAFGTGRHKKWVRLFCNNHSCLVLVEVNGTATEINTSDPATIDVFAGRVIAFAHGKEIAHATGDRVHRVRISIGRVLNPLGFTAAVTRAGSFTKVDKYRFGSEAIGLAH